MFFKLLINGVKHRLEILSLLFLFIGRDKIEFDNKNYEISLFLICWPRLLNGTIVETYGQNLFIKGENNGNY